MSLVKS